MIDKAQAEEQRSCIGQENALLMAHWSSSWLNDPPHGSMVKSLLPVLLRSVDTLIALALKEEVEAMQHQIMETLTRD